jgi:8-oxo-dGTP diphosphatase
MARTPVLAAGGIVVRGGGKPLIAIVQRRKDGDWVLPKGKLKAKENPAAAARREVIEETGRNVFVHEYLGAISYQAGRKPKVVQFWRMQAAEGPERELMDDIKAVAWLPLPAAIEKLSQPIEQAFLRAVGRRAVTRMEPKARRGEPVRKKRAVRKPPTVRKPPAVREEPVVRGEPHILIGSAGLPSFLRQIMGRFRRDPSDDAAAGITRS